MQVGGRLSRVDGPAKITGAAKYAVEQQLDGLAYAVLVESTIASGKVRAIDTAAAEAAPGVLKVLTPDTIMQPEDRIRLVRHAAAGQALLPAGARHHLLRPACRGCRRRDLRAGGRGGGAGQGQL